MPKGAVYIGELLDFELLGAAAPTLPATLYLAFHTASPAGGDQTTNEVTTGAAGEYVRKGVTRSGAEFSRSGQVASLINAQRWPQILTGTGAAVATFVSVGVAAYGASKMLRYSAIADLPLTIGATPRLPAGTTFPEV